MKKIAVCILVAVFVFTFAGFAESIDLDSLSEYELMELNKKIEAKLFSMDPESVNVLYSGTYVAGESIDPGSYRFTVVGRRYGWISVYDSLDALADPERGPIISCDRLPTGETVHFDLKNGNALVIRNGVFSVK